MIDRSALRTLVFTALLTGWFGASTSAKLPKEDVIDVPAVGDGLCVSNVFQSSMVIQRDKPIAVWGWASPGETVTVSFSGDEAATTTAEDRRWKVSLPAKSASAKPLKMVVTGAGTALTLDNLLIGDVWILGGQSNMEFPLHKVENGALEIVSANFPEIRILTVPAQNGAELKQAFPRLHEWSSWSGRHFRKGDWDVCSPEIARELSAIGYVFARRVHKAAGVPIGVIDTSRGGTTVETWTPDGVLRKMESEPVQAKLAEWDQKLAEWDAEADLAKRVQRHHQWVARMEKEGKPIPADRVVPVDLRPGPSMDQNRPGNCFASMIGPLVGLSVKGAIFHQGYNNAFDGSRGVALYRDVFPAMINAWRTALGDPELPFGILSLCTDGYPQTRADYVEKMHNAGIAIRAAQYETFSKLYQAGDQNVGFVSTYDLRRRWYHPQLKLPAGERIARWALATEYGFERELSWKPPMLVSIKKQDDTLLLEFDTDVGDAEDGAIEGFAIAGEDRRFQPAAADYVTEGKDNRGRPKLNRKKLVLQSPLVPGPVHYRYAWGRNPLANLQATGHKDLPFATQRSDDWKIEEVPLGVLNEPVEGKLSRQQRNRLIRALKKQDTERRLFEAERYIEENKQ
ncbi:MAG: hypothetical protein AAF514_09295 [Verrucomicrobiota bacterium]